MEQFGVGVVEDDNAALTGCASHLASLLRRTLPRLTGARRAGWGPAFSHNAGCALGSGRVRFGPGRTGAEASCRSTTVASSVSERAWSGQRSPRPRPSARRTRPRHGLTCGRLGSPTRRQEPRGPSWPVGVREDHVGQDEVDPRCRVREGGPAPPRRCPPRAPYGRSNLRARAAKARTPTSSSTRRIVPRTNWVGSLLLATTLERRRRDMSGKTQREGRATPNLAVHEHVGAGLLDDPQTVESQGRRSPGFLVV
jgi:hypothetical protein